MTHGYEASHEKETSFHVTIRVLLLGDIATVASAVCDRCSRQIHFTTRWILLFKIIYDKMRLMKKDVLYERIARVTEDERPFALMSIGAAGSGKSTRLLELQREFDLARVSPDDIRERVVGPVYDPTRNQEVWDIAMQDAAEHIAAGESLIMDATHYGEAWRREHAARYRQMGAQAVFGAVFLLEVDTIMQRMEQRDRKVPRSEVERMQNAIIATPPTLDEGFDDIIFVDTR